MSAKPKPEPVAPAATQKPKSRDGAEMEASSQLTQLALFGLLAFVAWFVAVETPKLARIEGLLTSVQKLQKQNSELKSQLANLGKELDRVEKASPSGLQASSMKVFQREYEDRIAAIRGIVEDMQRQVSVDKKIREEHRSKDRDAVDELHRQLRLVDRQVLNLREEIDSAQRLEKANALLEGRLPADFGRPGGADAAKGEEEEEDEDAGAGSDENSSDDIQEPTGGLVEFRRGDFDKMLREGDSWVVMFYAPWCGHCAAAAPDFQQAALQAPVHFARIDAEAHPDVAQSEGITGFPTIRLYSKGKVVRTHDGGRTVRELLDFARGASSKGGPPLS
jgi:thiol-disulfide isomerase/thioredoxin